jgi:hypothetical protein
MGKTHFCVVFTFINEVTYAEDTEHSGAWGGVVVKALRY